MALTTLSTVYTYYGTYNSAIPYIAKNNAAKAWIEDMAAASIAGLTYSDKVSPDVTTSAQTFSVTFETTQEYFIQFSITTSTSAYPSASISLLAEDGTLINSLSIGTTMSYATPIATIQINLIRYFFASNYDIYAASGFGSITTFYPIGAVYTENKTPTAPDYLVCSGIANTNICVYDATHKVQTKLPMMGAPNEATGTCAMIDAIALLDTNSNFLCTLKNCKHIGIAEGTSKLLTYTVGGVTYINVAYGYVWLHVT